MIEFLKDLINKNEDVKKALQDCSDDFLLENQSIILAALDEDSFKEGYKIRLQVKDGIIEWEYIPTNENSIEFELINSISANYSYKLPNDWSHHYLINLNDVNWTEDKRELVKPMKNILKAAKEKKSIKGFWLWGSNESGKSFATIALLNMLSKEGKKVSFVNMSDLLLSAQKSMNDYNTSTMEIIEKIKKSDVIVLDDIGSERPTPWFKENVLLPIIDYRVKSNKTTIFTSNVNIEKYHARLNARSQNPDSEKETNDKIISRIKTLINNLEIKIG